MAVVGLLHHPLMDDFKTTYCPNNGLTQSYLAHIPGQEHPSPST